MDSGITNTAGTRILRRGGTRLDFAIRPCREADLEALEWMGLHTPHREIIRNAFERHRRGDEVMLVADANGFPIGQVWVDLARKRHQGAALLWAVRVFPPLQNLGIGRELMAAAEDVILAHGLKRSELGVERDNPAARRFYERLGYRLAGRAVDNYTYVTPDGVPTRVPLDQWILSKDLASPAP
ncbi:GNAT family N-acetyltransferase [Arenibaculum sp.]|uniref:GNAT family N-acetyltransferase n=1 Tax=Arenibaculum sp. TaxID=2865862 RepID=UPI002E1583F4|nr:GNAT family N-acetyltransferase [Arenibaculum sp.]